MANQNEPLDLIREKQELDIFLCNITAAGLPHKVTEKKTIADMEKEEKLPVSHPNESFNLIREKQEMDIFLSRITVSRLPNGLIQEKPAVAVGMEERLTVSDRLPAFAETERPSLSDRESISDQFEEKKIVSALKTGEEGKISVDPVQDVKPVKDNFTDRRTETEGQFQILVAKRTLDSVDIQQEATRKADLPDILLSDEILKTDQTVALKVDDQSEIAPAPLGESIDEEQKTQTDEPLKNEEIQISRGKRMRLIVFFMVFMVFIVMTQGYLWIYPDAGHETVQWICSKFPVIEQLLGVEKGNVDIVTNQIEFIDVKQRFVSNESLGDMRVIEGTLVNQAEVPIAKIKVMGELLGSRGELLAARVSYCGNIISDEILGRLEAEEISYISSFFKSENGLNKRIMPKGQIPFMIVFTREPAGVVKATVTAVGAEKYRHSKNSVF